jgi:hypothetical protein
VALFAYENLTIIVCRSPEAGNSEDSSEEENIESTLLVKKSPNTVARKLIHYFTDKNI